MIIINNISPSKAKMSTINNAKKIRGRKVGRRTNLDTEGQATENSVPPGTQQVGFLRAQSALYNPHRPRSAFQIRTCLVW